MRQSRTRKKLPRGTVTISGYGEVASGGHMMMGQPEPQRRVADGGEGSGTASGGSSFDNGCVDCHDYYEIHV